MTVPRQAMGADDIRPFFNNTGSAIVAKVAVKLTGVVDEGSLPAADTDALLGVNLTDVPDGQWGCAQIRGKAKVLAAGALATPGVQLKTNTAGKAIAWTAAAGANAHVLGTLLNTAAALDDTIEVELAGPGTIQQG